MPSGYLYPTCYGETNKPSPTYNRCNWDGDFLFVYGYSGDTWRWDRYWLKFILGKNYDWETISRMDLVLTNVRSAGWGKNVTFYEGTAYPPDFECCEITYNTEPSYGFVNRTKAYFHPRYDGSSFWMILYPDKLWKHDKEFGICIWKDDWSQYWLRCSSIIIHVEYEEKEEKPAAFCGRESERDLKR